MEKRRTKLRTPSAVLNLILPSRYARYVENALLREVFAPDHKHGAVLEPMLFLQETNLEESAKEYAKTARPSLSLRAWPCNNRCKALGIEKVSNQRKRARKASSSKRLREKSSFKPTPSTLAHEEQRGKLARGTKAKRSAWCWASIRRFSRSLIGSPSRKNRASLSHATRLLHFS